MSGKHLDWFSRALDQLTARLHLDAAGSQTLLKFDLTLTLFLAFCLAAFLFHDVIWLVLTSFFGKEGEYHAFSVFLVSAVIVAISLISILLHELSVTRRK